MHLFSARKSSKGDIQEHACGLVVCRVPAEDTESNHKRGKKKDDQTRNNPLGNKKNDSSAKVRLQDSKDYYRCGLHLTYYTIQLDYQRAGKPGANNDIVTQMIQRKLYISK